jgi:hypothetical protein
VTGDTNFYDFVHMRFSIILLAGATLMFSSINFATAASAAADANGNATSETAAGSEDQDAELAKQLQNPVASLISVPFQNNFDFNIGPNDDGFRYTMNFQPVIPFSISKDWNLIVRTIVPFIYQDDVIPGTSQTGLGDTTQSFFFSPKQPVGGWIVAFGPALLWPTGTNDLLGTEKWGAGPTGLLLKQQAGWTYGVLANQIWSYAGDDHRNYVSSTFIQPFITYTTKMKTTFGVNAESTYDWRAEQWTVPINVFVSQLVRIGKIPVSFSFGGRVYAEGPSGNADWGLRFVVTPLFPTGKKPAAAERTSAK